MMKLMLVMSMKERKTPKTMYRYRLRTRGLREEKSRDFVLFSDIELLLRDEVELIEETLMERGFRSFLI